MEAKYPEITLGETVYDKIKTIYFDNQPSSLVYNKIAQKFSELKAIMRKFYTEKSDIEILSELQKYSPSEIREALESEKSVTSSKHK